MRRRPLISTSPHGSPTSSVKSFVRDSPVLTGRCECGHWMILDNFSEEECLCCREVGDPVLLRSLKDASQSTRSSTSCLNIAVLRTSNSL
ncbi:hypothetical protein HPB52_025340 [Rhipicephalus sanguineus]|uniref:Uncharacterized protein n=1 Tax=Rhipicephalus sanguineus TaxID=34632 RepID=A0A9D4YRL6_RHISA|nr:hypothetical protein HPB52_025340 [Rhipicephalus sanguineus]